MTSVTLSRGNFFLLLLVVAAAVALLEFGGLADGRGALLVTLVFWTLLAQGAVAVVAVTDLTGARWSASLKRELLAACPLLPLLAGLFLLVWPLLDLYPWAAVPTAWLNRPFFFGRNLALLLAVAGAAHLFAHHSLREDPEKALYAVIYLFLFVAAQSLVAFDWVMSLAYPWVSTMFGAYFFVEALYAGLALAGLLSFFLDRQKQAQDAAWPAHRRDVGLLLFGFSILWGGLFFAQYLLLWYGNLPEEVHFVAERVASSPTRELCVLFLIGSFAVPFLTLLSARAKRHAGVLGAVSLIVLLGMLAEKLVFTLPAVPLNFGVLLVENGLLLAVWLLSVQSGDRLLPGGVGGVRSEE